MPEFEIECTAAFVNSPFPTVCKIIGTDFDADWAIKSFQVDWLVTPRVPNTTAVHEQFLIAPNQYQIFQEYVIVATITQKDYPEVTETLNMQFTPDFADEAEIIAAWQNRS